MKVNTIITLKKPDIDEQLTGLLLAHQKVGALGEIGIPYFLYIAGDSRGDAR